MLITHGPKVGVLLRSCSLLLHNIPVQQTNKQKIKLQSSVLKQSLLWRCSTQNLHFCHNNNHSYLATTTSCNNNILQQHPETTTPCSSNLQYVCTFWRFKYIVIKLKLQHYFREEPLMRAEHKLKCGTKVSAILLPAEHGSSVVRRVTGTIHNHFRFIGHRDVQALREREKWGHKRYNMGISGIIITLRCIWKISTLLGCLSFIKIGILRNIRDVNMKTARPSKT